MPLPVYLVDFSCFKPPNEYKLNMDQAKEQGRSWPMYQEDIVEFMMKVFDKSGLSSTSTYLPPAVHPCLTNNPDNGMDSARKEAEMVMFGAVGDLLKKTRVNPSDIDIVVTTCSIFCPTPSMASILVNHFKFRSDIQTYHLGGMGCGNGVIAIGLVKELLQAWPNSNALFVASEITSYCFYPGKEKNFMVANVIFRMGGAAVLLSNKASERKRAKYQLLHNVRVHTGADDGAYGCMAWRPDKEGINGVYLGRDVVQHAAKALELCVRKISPRIITWTQTAEAVVNYVRRQMMGSKEAEYKPDFTRCVDHFAIHAGGYAVLKGIQMGLELPTACMVPSFAMLREYGNTSCSTTWYVLGYLESCDNVRKGQKVMQVGMGGGMEAGVNIWQALRDVKSVHKAWEHLADNPLTEFDMPRHIEAVGVKKQPEEDQNTGADHHAVAKQAVSEFGTAKDVRRRITVNVTAEVMEEAA